MASVEAATADVSGQVGVAAKHLDSLEELHVRSDETYLTASTFKVPILAEVYRQVDAGLIDPAGRVDVSDDLRAPGSGSVEGAGVRFAAHRPRSGVAHDNHKRQYRYRHALSHGRARAAQRDNAGPRSNSDAAAYVLPGDALQHVRRGHRRR